MTDLRTTLESIDPLFEDPTVGMNKIQRVYLAALEAGSDPIRELVGTPDYDAVLNAWKGRTGRVGQSRDKFLAMKRAEQEFYRACAAEHAGRYRASQSTVDAAVLLVIDAEGNVQPRAALLTAGVPADDVSRITSKTGSRRKVKKALAKHADHQNAQRMIRSEGKREYMRLAADTLSGSLEGIAVNMKTQARLARLEQSEADHARRIADLEARLAAVEVRHAIDDAGTDPRREALRMRSEGMGYKAIGKALGRSPATVQSWVRRAG
jgi:DNA-binding NarL/FixJ family response regulator